MVLTRKAIIAAAVVTATAALAACSSAATSTMTAGASAVTAPVPVAANPVPLLVATGATPEPGETFGSTDIEGDRYATGSYPDGEEVAVYTFTSAAAQAADLARNGIPGDGHAIITSRLVDIYVTATDSAGGYTFTVTPAQIAARTGGKVTSP